MPVITIAREYGAGGLSVARLLAEELDAPIIDRSLIADVARRTHLTAAQVEDEDEQGRSLLDRIARSFGTLGETAGGWAADPEYFIDHHGEVLAFTRAALEEAARMGNAIIVGRGGAAALRDVPDACHVYLWAPEEHRIREVRRRLGCDVATARREIHAVDSRRAAYVREAYSVDWRNRELYDLILNTARLGYAGAAACIVAAVATRASEPEPASEPVPELAAPH